MARSSLLVLFLVYHLPTIHSHVIDCSLPEHECAIECYGENSCSHSHITGPTLQRGDLAVYCLGDRACLGSTIDGHSSFKTEINGCAEFESCLDLSIYAPPRRNNTSAPHCIVHGNDNLGATQIFATNSWRDIDIVYSGHFGEYDGRMFCGKEFGASCEISPNWTCANSDDFCSVDEFGEVRLPVDENVGDIFDEEDIEVDIDDEGVVYAVGDGDGESGSGFEDYLFVGAGVLALAVGWMLCGCGRHLLKGHVVRQKSVKMGYGPYEAQSSHRASVTGTGQTTTVDVHRVDTRYVDPSEKYDYAE